MRIPRPTLRAATGTSRSIRLGPWRLLLDREPRRGPERAPTVPVTYRTDLVKEELARRYVLDRPGEGLAFLDVGARDGRLDYLLGVTRDVAFDAALHERNLQRFRAKYRYYGLDLEPLDAPDVLTMDLCAASTAVTDRYRDHFDVVYSNNVFEHLRRPWIAAKHILDMTKPGGLIVTIAPFAIRYHAVPGDYFRYTHDGLVAVFADQGQVDVLESGYDVIGRRVDWQGKGAHQDIVPEDAFGAWRENWFTVSVLRKPEVA
jgi:SAM-dependent methyltransferase